jgi:hypothetical protein
LAYELNILQHGAVRVPEAWEFAIDAVRAHALNGFVARDGPSECGSVSFENLCDLDEVVDLKAEAADTDEVTPQRFAARAVSSPCSTMT